MIRIPPYDILYSSSPGNILWGDQPGRLLPWLKDYLTLGTVLDVGCGDGKNDVFLERKGFDVHGIDISSLALNGLRGRFANQGITCKGRYETRDIYQIRVNETYDAMISYGLYHCLDLHDRNKLHNNLQGLVKVGGIVLFTCLTDNIPIRRPHGTTNIVLAKESEVMNLFHNWKIEHLETGIIKERHLPIIGDHEHSAIWLIARKKY